MGSLLRPADQPVERLQDAHRDELRQLVDQDPLVNLLVAARLQDSRSLEPRFFGASVYGRRDDENRLVAAVCVGGNLSPVGGDEAHWPHLARHVARTRPTCTAVVGRADAVHAMWNVLRQHWPPARAIRAAQPLLVLDTADSLPPADARLRAVGPADLESYIPAAAAMFTEELDASPFAHGGPDAYRRRIRALIRAGRAFAVSDPDGAVVFKADIGAVSAHTCQVQGVWVRPDMRGRGLGTSALAGVLRHALTLAPTVSLYVNDYNTPARRMYANLGMQQVATLATVLL